MNEPLRYAIVTNFVCIFKKSICGRVLFLCMYTFFIKKILYIIVYMFLLQLALGISLFFCYKYELLYNIRNESNITYVIIIIIFYKGITIPFFYLYSIKKEVST